MKTAEDWKLKKTQKKAQARAQSLAKAERMRAVRLSPARSPAPAPAPPPVSAAAGQGVACELREAASASAPWPLPLPAVCRPTDCATERRTAPVLLRPTTWQATAQMSEEEREARRIKTQALIAERKLANESGAAVNGPILFPREGRTRTPTLICVDPALALTD